MKVASIRLRKKICIFLGFLRKTSCHNNKIHTENVWMLPVSLRAVLQYLCLSVFV